MLPLQQCRSYMFDWIQNLNLCVEYMLCNLRCLKSESQDSKRQEPRNWYQNPNFGHRWHCIRYLSSFAYLTMAAIMLCHFGKKFQVFQVTLCEKGAEISDISLLLQCNVLEMQFFNSNFTVIATDFKNLSLSQSTFTTSNTYVCKD